MWGVHNDLLLIKGTGLTFPSIPKLVYCASHNPITSLQKTFSSVLLDECFPNRRLQPISVSSQYPPFVNKTDLKRSQSKGSKGTIS